MSFGAFIPKQPRSNSIATLNAIPAKSIGDSIRFHRMKLRLSQVDFSAQLKKLGVSIDQSKLSQIENGKARVEETALHPICDCLDCSADELLALANRFHQITATQVEPNAPSAAYPLEADAQRIRDCHDGSGDTIWNWDCQSTAFWISDTVYDLTGRQATEMSRLISSSADLLAATGLHRDDYTAVLSLLKEHESRRDGSRFDFRCRINTGGRGPIAVRIKGRFFYEGEQLLKAAGSVSQISDADFYASQAIDNMEDCFFFAKDSDCRFTYVSPSLARRMGKPSEKIIGTLDSDHLENRFQVFGFKDDDERTLNCESDELPGESVKNSRLAIDEETLTVGDEVTILSTVKTQVIMPNGEVQIFGFAVDTTREAALRYGLDTLLKASDDSIYLKDLDGKFIFANRAMARSVGMQRGNDLVGKTDFDLFPDELAKQWLDEERAIALNKSAVVNSVSTIWAMEGEKKHRLVSKYPVLSRDGDVIAIAGCARDITDVVRSTRTAEKQTYSPRVRESVSAIEESAWMINDLNEITFFNETFKREFLYDGTSSLESLLKDRCSIRLGTLYRKSVRELAIVSDFVLLELCSGKKVPANVYSFPVFDEDDRAIGTLFVARDVNAQGPITGMANVRDAIKDAGLRLIS